MGDTVGAMSVSEPDGFHSNFAPLLCCFATDFVTPSDGDELERLEQNRPEQYAAFIVEPLVQGAGGMNFYEPSYLQLLKSFCERHGIVLIFDEVFTGFWTLGKVVCISTGFNRSRYFMCFQRHYGRFLAHGGHAGYGGNF